MYKRLSVEIIIFSAFIFVISLLLCLFLFCVDFKDLLWVSILYVLIPSFLGWALSVFITSIISSFGDVKELKIVRFWLNIIFSALIFLGFASFIVFDKNRRSGSGDLFSLVTFAAGIYMIVGCLCRLSLIGTKDEEETEERTYNID